MAFSFDAKTQADATSTGLTVSHTASASATLLVVGIVLRGFQTINSLTYGGQALTLAKEDALSTDQERTAIYYKVNPPTGANNLVVGLSASVQHSVSVSSWIATSPSLDVTGSATGTSTTPAASVSGAVGGLGIDCVSSESNSNPPFSSAGGDQTILHNVSAGGSGSWGIGTSYELSPSASETFNWTTGSGVGETWAHVVAVFTEGAAAVAPSFLAKPLLPRLAMFKVVDFALSFPLPAPVLPPSAVSESPTPGGAIADGFGPVVQVTATQGGAIAAGTAPTARASLTIGGAVAAGNSPVTQTSVTQGGASTGGSAPTARVPVGQGGATAGGFAPTESSAGSETPTPGGAVAGGFGPVARVTLTIGGAVASGTAPAVSTTVTQGGATAGGFGPSPARVTFSIGGAVAGGFAPSEVGPTTPTPGGAVAGGFGPTARVSLTIGGAVAGGLAPAQGNLVQIGGATAAGFGATVRVSLTIGGATAGGFEPSIPVVTPLPPYVASRPMSGLQNDSEGAVRSSGRSGGLTSAARGRIRRG